MIEGRYLYHHLSGALLAHGELGVFSVIVMIDFREAMKHVDANHVRVAHNLNQTTVKANVQLQMLLPQIMSREASAVGVAPIGKLVGIGVGNQFADQTVKLGAKGIRRRSTLKDQREIGHHRRAVLLLVGFKQSFRKGRQGIRPRFIPSDVMHREGRFIGKHRPRLPIGVGNAGRDGLVGKVDKPTHRTRIQNVDITGKGTDVVGTMCSLIGGFYAKNIQRFKFPHIAFARILGKGDGLHPFPFHKAFVLPLCSDGIFGRPNDLVGLVIDAKSNVLSLIVGTAANHVKAFAFQLRVSFQNTTVGVAAGIAVLVVEPIWQSLFLQLTNDVAKIRHVFRGCEKAVLVRRIGNNTAVTVGKYGIH